MNINSVSNTAGINYAQSIQRQPEAAEKGPDHDGDSDDGKSIKASPSPTVNLNGQAVGQLINALA